MLGRVDKRANRMQGILLLVEKANCDTEKRDPIVTSQVRDFFIDGFRDPGVKLAIL